jgi:hypothetical protein
LAQAGSSSWSSFSQDIQNGQLNLGIGFVNAKQAQSLLTAEVLAQYKVILTHLEPNETHSSTLLTNFTLRRDYSSTEDIAPTALNILGCDAPVHTYSTGRDLRSNQGLQYLVSTSGSKILLLEGQHRTEIMNNGKVEIFDLTTNQEVSTAIDTTLLSQSIKHLSRFSAKRNYYPQ